MGRKAGARRCGTRGVPELPQIANRPWCGVWPGLRHGAARIGGEGGIRAESGASRSTLKPLATPDRATRELAEREGFEPPVRFPAQRFSRPPVSTTHTPLRYLLRGRCPRTPDSLSRSTRLSTRTFRQVSLRSRGSRRSARSLLLRGVAPGPRHPGTAAPQHPSTAAQPPGTPEPGNAISQSDPSPCRAAAPQESRSIHRPAGSSPESR
jgi:hypothetical protein